jgi:hypothetical protein
MRCTVVAKGCAFFAQRLALALSTSKKCFTKISGQSKSTNRSPQRLLTALPSSNFGILAPEHQGYDQTQNTDGGHHSQNCRDAELTF